MYLIWFVSSYFVKIKTKFNGSGVWMTNNKKKDQPL